jgi:tetratricopeptide (TPR) repeat protein
MAFDKKAEDIKQLLKNATDLEVKGKVKEAVAELERAIRLNPADGGLYNRVGDLYVKIGKIRDAVDFYLRGIDAFKADNFYRNALGLCKKVLRYDPGNVEINYVIAQLLAELDEKSDAMIYVFSYIERQMAAGNKKEVMKAMEFMKGLKVSDRAVTDKMAKIYEHVGETKKAEAIKQTEKKDETFGEPKFSEDIELRPIYDEEQAAKASRSTMDEAPVNVNHENNDLKQHIDRLDSITSEAERTLGELRKAMRIDEVVIALDKSLSVFSSQQKESISVLHKSLNSNLEALQRSIKDLQECSAGNAKAVEGLLGDFKRALVDMSRNQESIVREINRSLEGSNRAFDATSKSILGEMKNLTGSYRESSTEVCAKMEDTKQSTVALMKVSGEIKAGLQAVNDALFKFFLAQESKDRKFNKSLMIITVLLGVIAVLSILSLIIGK